ncbi:universal stress protein [Actinoplanes sp. NPDC024001]|uniref:universal stress protein n=1 Tax=Actinoplanes sp. NPDC024001 TaxID=3154598 RepID=UPI0034093D2D
MRNVVSVEEKLPVVVGLDGMPAGQHVLDAAAAEAADRGVPLEIVHAWPGRRAGSPRQRLMRPDPAEGRHLLELAARRARHIHPALLVRTELVDDSAAETLVQRSAQACLVVVGHRGETTLRHGWGSTAAYLAHHSRCPLLVHRGSAPGRGPVVVAASGRPTATAGCAYEAASLAGCPLVAVHVRAPEETGTGPAGSRLTASIATWTAVWPDVPCEPLVIGEAELAYTLDRASRRGRLLVAGRGRKGWFVETLYSIGSIAPGGRQQCPVLLVPPGWPVTGTPMNVGPRRSDEHGSPTVPA